MQVIKFAESEPERTITIVDKGILDVKTGIANTEAGNDELQRRIDEYVHFSRVLLPSNHSDSYQTRPKRTRVHSTGAEGSSAESHSI